MPTSLDSEIRSQLARYLNNAISLREFEDLCTVNALLVIGQEGNLEARQRASEIELRLDEYSDGGWDESELRSLLTPLVESRQVDQSLSMRPR